MVVAFTASWRMTLVMLAVVPVLAVAAFLQFKFVVSASSKVGWKGLLSLKQLADLGPAVRTLLLFQQGLTRP